LNCIVAYDNSPYTQQNQQLKILMSNNDSSQAQWIERAHRVLPAGGFGNFDAGIVIKRGLASHVWDEDDNEYIDYLIGSGPMLLGHCHPEVNEAVQQQLSKGMTFFANNAAGVELAEVIVDAVPCAEQLRYVSTGGEADMYAMRLARAFTGRNKILKFEGGYHGMSAEALMSLAPTELVNFPTAVPDSAGIPDSVKEQMVIAPFNDPDALTALLDEHGSDIAGLIVEPLQRLIPPVPGFLELLRKETEKRGIVLIFDEVVTGFRFAYGGAQEYYGVTPDLCTLGKIIGGGMPMAAIAGKTEILNHFDRAKVGDRGFAYQIGTLSGNPLSAVAGLKSLEILRRPGTYDVLKTYGETLMNGISDRLSQRGVAHQMVGEPMLFDVLFSAEPVTNYRHVLAADAKANTVYNDVLRQNGIFKSPGKMYPSVSLTEGDIEKTLAAVDLAAEAVATA
jgi:glutamate-1-semialdehyde 2,1-aminomutase